MLKSGKYKQGGPIINRSRISGKCRVESCRFYHKYLKDLKGHIQRAHDLTLASHKKLPPSLLCIVHKKNKGKDYMKYRKVELCYFKGCKEYMQPLTDLTRHLRINHNGMKIKEYKEKRKPMEDETQSRSVEDSSEVKNKTEPIDKNEGNESESERSDLLDSDCTLSPFYPESMNEEEDDQFNIDGSN